MIYALDIATAHAIVMDVVGDSALAGEVLDALGIPHDIEPGMLAVDASQYLAGVAEQRARIRAEIKPHILKLQLVLETCWTEDNEPSETATEVAADVLAIIAEDDSDE